MLDKATFSQLTLEARKELSHQHLHNTIGILLNLLEMLDGLSCQPAMKEQLNAIKSDYGRLLHYMKEGPEDPLRTALQQRLTEKIFTILQDLIREYELYTQENIYTTVAKECWKKHPREAFLSMLQHNFFNDFEAQDNLFNYIWTSPQLTHQEEMLLKLLLIGQDTLVRQYVLSALSLSIVHYFDPAKMRLLCDDSHITNQTEQAKAIIGIFLAVSIQHSSITLFPTIQKELSSCIDLHKINMLTILQHFTCLYFESERIHEKMEKIIPALIKISQSQQTDRLNPLEINLDESQPFINSQTKAKLAEGIMEIARLSKEGMDTNFYTFIPLKKFPFFQSVGHWLAPFTEDRPDSPAIGLSKLPLCDNDKYSLSIFFHHQKNKEQMNEMQTIIDKIQSHTDSKSNQQHIQEAIQCFYRLFKCSPWISIWPDIFTLEKLLIYNPILSPILENNNRFLKKTGLLLLRNHHYQEAELHLHRYAKRNGKDLDLLMQLGECAQAQGHLRKAISYYQQANTLQPKTFDIKYKIQHCLSLFEKHEERLRYLQEMEEMDSDNAQVTMQTGLCLMQLKQWEQALQRFYKLEYREQEVAMSLRAIAWCLLRSGRLEEAEKYYLRLNEYFPTDTHWEDYLNAGHVAWAMGETKKALKRYIDYIHHYAVANPEESDLLNPFTEDHEVLHELGFNDHHIALMYDMISQNI